MFNLSLLVTSAILLSFISIIITAYQYPNLTGIEHLFKHGVERTVGDSNFSISIVEYILKVIPHKLMMNSNKVILILSICSIPWLYFTKNIDHQIKATFTFFGIYGIMPAILFVQGTVIHDYLITDISIFLTFSALYFTIDIIKNNKSGLINLIGKLSLSIFIVFTLLQSGITLFREYNTMNELPLEYPLALSIKKNTDFSEDIITNLDLRLWTMPFLSDSHIKKGISTVEKFDRLTKEKEKQNYSYFVTTNLEMLKDNNYFYQNGGLNDSFYRFKDSNDSLIKYLNNNYNSFYDDGFIFFNLKEIIY